MPYLVGYITPQDYNSAAGDGVTDCTAAIQSAITAAAAGSGGQTLFFPGGTYIISSTLTLSSLVTYLGSEEDATIIKAANATNLTAMAATTGWLNNTNTSAANPLQMRHIIWDGNSANQTSGAGHGVVLQSFYTNVEYCIFRNTRGDGLRWDVNTQNGGNTLTNTCVENRVVRCQFRNNGGDGFHSNDPTHNKLTDSWIIDCIVDTPTQNAIEIQASAGWKIDGCHLYTIGFSGIRVDRMFQTRVTNNFIESCGASATAGTYALIDGLNGQVNDGGQGSTIANNVGFFQGPAGNAGSTIVGIGVQAATAATATVSIVGNQLFQTGGTGTVAIQLQNQAASSSITARVASNTTVGWTTALNQVINGGTLTLNGDFGQYTAQPSASGNVVFSSNVLGTDSFDRFRIAGDGSMAIGPGSTNRDVLLQRTAVGTWSVTNPLTSHGAIEIVDGNFVVGGTTTTGDNGVGELQLKTVTTAPTTNPTGGTVFYSTGTVLLHRDTAGHLANLTWDDQAFQMNGFSAWNFDPNMASASNVSVSGTITLHKLYIPVTGNTTNVAVSVRTAGSGLTAGQNLIGLYNSAGTRVAQTADQTTNWGTTGAKVAAWTSPFNVTAPGVYYVAILSVGTTPVDLYGSPGSQNVYNANVSGATLVHAVGPAAQTSLPTSITMSSNTSSSLSIWAAVN